MAKRYYEPISGDLTLWKDPSIFVKEDLEADLSVIEEIQALSPEARSLYAQYHTMNTLSYFVDLDSIDISDFDDFLDELRTRLKNLIDFFDYNSTILNLNVKDGAWFTPEAVESVCGEDTGYPATNTIDGNTATYWEHDVNEQHNIIWRIRDYKKRISKIRVRVGSSSRNRLNGLDVYFSSTIDGLTNPSNRFITDAALATPNAWVEIEFDGSSKANGLYMKFADFQSDNPNNYVRIQEVQVWVTTIEYN